MSDIGEDNEDGYLEDQLRKSVERWVRRHPMVIRAQDVFAGKAFFTVVVEGAIVGAMTYIAIRGGFAPFPILLVTLAFLGLFFLFILWH